MIAPEQVKSLIEQGVEGSTAQAIDLTGTQDHYKVIVVTDSFDGKRLVQRHQMINESLKEPLKGPLHALTIEAYTKDEWAKKQDQQGPQGIKL